MGELKELPPEEIIKAIVAEIVSKAKILPTKNGADHFRLVYGSKQLFIDYGLGMHTFTAEVARLPDKTKPHAEHETTLLFRAAKEFMQQQVNRLATPALYTFDTNNAEMRAWARTRGKEIFNWVTTVEEGNATVCSRRFFPEKNKQE